MDCTSKPLSYLKLLGFAELLMTINRRFPFPLALQTGTIVMRVFSFFEPEETPELIVFENYNL